MTDLLSCPFCGGPGELRKGPPGCHWIACTKCEAGTADGSQDRAIAAWNRRTAPVDIEAVKKTAYQDGWNDREGDLLVGIDRLGAPSLPSREDVARDGEPTRYHFTDETPFVVKTAEGEVPLGKGWLAISEVEYAALNAPAPPAKEGR